jgi:hypothetical protein
VTAFARDINGLIEDALLIGGGRRPYPLLIVLLEIGHPLALEQTPAALVFELAKLSARGDHPPLASLGTASWSGRGGRARSAPLRLR